MGLPVLNFSNFPGHLLSIRFGLIYYSYLKEKVPSFLLFWAELFQKSNNIERV
jgi:hypothetical protein